LVPPTQNPGRSAIHARIRTPIVRRRRPSGSGQSLVEFALIFPIFFVLLLAVIEFAFALNALVSIDFATRDAALAAAEAGNTDDADCSILRALDSSMTAPANNSRVSEVRIFKADVNGSPATVAYRLLSGTYPESSRCNELEGCKVQPTVDTIGVQIHYGYGWVTPLHTFIPSMGPGYSMVKSNAMRMEPIL
jgi:Flp pilus assembly protein TadG